MGTPEFAVPSLRALVAGGYNVVGVVTARQTRGRGRQLRESDEDRRLGLGLPVLQPERLKAPEFVAAMQALRPDLGDHHRVPHAARGRVGHAATGNLQPPRLAAASVQGAAPINWAIINGERGDGRRPSC